MNNEQKAVVNALKAFVNDNPTSFVWHNGEADRGCSFHGLHIHLIVSISENSITKCDAWVSLREKMKRCNGTLKAQIVRKPESLMAYLMKAPRILLGCNNVKMCGRAQRAISDIGRCMIEEWGGFATLEDVVDEAAAAQPQSPPATTSFMSRMLGVQGSTDDNPIEMSDNELVSVAELIEREATNKIVSKPDKKPYAGNKEPQIVATVDVLIDLMSKYGTTDADGMLKEIISRDNTDDLRSVRAIRMCYNATALWAQAKQELDMKRDLSQPTYLDQFYAEAEVLQTTDDSILSVQETAILFQDWCREQVIDPIALLDDFYCVLGMRVPKRNCIALIGGSNAGKSFWTAPLIMQGFYGETISSGDFAWQECVDRKLISIPEITFSKIDQVEIAKQVFEGMPVFVNRKNKKGALLERKPVILTANALPWKFFDDHSEAFNNRCFLYTDLKESNVLKNTKKPNVSFFIEIFRAIQTCEDDSPLGPTKFLNDKFRTERHKAIRLRFKQILRSTYTVQALTALMGDLEKYDKDAPYYPYRIPDEDIKHFTHPGSDEITGKKRFFATLMLTDFEIDENEMVQLSDKGGLRLYDSPETRWWAFHTLRLAVEHAKRNYEELAISTFNAEIQTRVVLRQFFLQAYQSVLEIFAQLHLLPEDYNPLTDFYIPRIESDLKDLKGTVGVLFSDSPMASFMSRGTVRDNPPDSPDGNICVLPALKRKWTSRKGKGPVKRLHFEDVEEPAQTLCPPPPPPPSPEKKKPTLKKTKAYTDLEDWLYCNKNKVVVPNSPEAPSSPDSDMVGPSQIPETQDDMDEWWTPPGGQVESDATVSPNDESVHPVSEVESPQEDAQEMSFDSD